VIQCVCKKPHRCHANGCEDPELHDELPFCQDHFKMLPVAHRNKLWKLRPYGQCGICDPRAAIDEWHELANLAIVLLCRMEYGRHGCPPELRDETGFCWGCGCHGVPRSYEVAEKVVRRFNLPAVRS
jgi:hypothetical protein